ncbi:hemagglutinin repeat-containing protein, partial [Stenotrophomonas maltophilia]|uniref:hemagglutinin repeat-containing protein n=1 Tax=Stenotrophomonas maltophilia TaxID=40324 RepID=UPI0011DD9D8D
MIACRTCEAWRRKNISMKAEGDITLRGATAAADRIDVKTGGTLTIESLQDI